MLSGYWGKLLRIDLSDRSVSVDEFDEDVLRKYIGGAGLGARILYDETTAETDPLGPENRLIVTTGPFTDTTAITSGRHAVVSKSPLGIYGESDVGGNWGFGLKRTGYDGVVISGQSSAPLYLLITDERVEIRDAAHLWGRDTFEVDAIIKGETSKGMRVQSIGPAGEHRVTISSIMTDGRNARALGRGGLGAVMGAKGLKAIAVVGDKRIPLFKPEGLIDSVKNLAPTIRENMQARNWLGTAGGVLLAEKVGDLPIQNWRRGSWKSGAEKISGERMAETILTGKYYCKACVVGCGRKVKIGAGPYAVDGAGPEYETLGAFGSMCLIDNLEAIAKANDLCNRLGLDTISTGSAIAFAMEAVERGLITYSDLDGIELRWGDAHSTIKLIEKIGKVEGIGKLLGQGVRDAAAVIGGDARELAIEVKGLELPMHDPRAYNSLAVAYATSNRGACHGAASHLLELRASLPELGYPESLDRFATKGKGVMTAKMQDYIGMFNALKLCRFVFPQLRFSDILTWIHCVTGWDMDAKELLETGERLHTIKRMYNVRCGIRREDDSLPERILNEKRGQGGAADNLPDLNTMLEEYYRYRIWDNRGIPEEDKLRGLGLKREIEDIP